MFIKSITLSNFQCFSEIPVTIELEEDITCLIGNNGAGKTSVLKALQRLFGRTAEERKIVKSDFHTVLYETDIKNKQLYIDIIFEFKAEEDDKILAFFSPMIYESKNKVFHARIRLESVWNEDEYEDDVTSSLFWILTDNDVDFGDESSLKIKVENHERKKIDFIYVPAVRNVKNNLVSELKYITKKL